MAENFIKHEDLIEGGNPFSEANAGLSVMIDQLEKLLVMLKGDLKTALSEISGLNIVKEADQKQLIQYEQKIAELEAQVKQLASSLERLKKAKEETNKKTDEEIKAEIRLSAERKKHRRELEMEVKTEGAAADSKVVLQKKLDALLAKYVTVSKEMRQKMAPAIAAVRKEINQAEEATGKHTGSVGRYQKAWDGLKGIIGKATGIIAGAYGAIKIGQSIMEQSSAFGDKLQITFKGMADAWNYTAKALGSGDFSNFFTNIREAARAGREYAEVLDMLEDRTRAYSLQESDANKEISKLRFIYKDATKSNQERIAAIDEILRLEKELAITRKDMAATAYDAEITRAAKLSGLTNEQIVAYIKMEEAISGDVMAGQGLLAMQDMYKAKGAAGLIELVKFNNGLTDQQKQWMQLALNVAKLSEGNELDKIVALYRSMTEAETAWMDNTNRAWSQRQSMMEEIQKKAVADAVKVTKEIEEIAEEDDSSDIWALNYMKASQDANEQIVADKEKTDAEVLKMNEEYWKKREEQTREAIDKEIEEEERKRKIITQLLDYGQQLGTAVIGLRISELESSYNEEIRLAENNEAAKEAIEKKYAQKRQKLAIGQALIDGASAVLNGLLTKPFIPAGILAGGTAATLAGIEIATIKKQRFSEGGSGLLDDSGGVLQGRSHAEGGINLGQIGEAERGEYFGIVNKSMTNKYRNILPDVFNSLNKGEFENVWGRAIAQLQPVVIQSGDEHILRSIDAHLKKMASRYSVQLGEKVMVVDGNRKYILPA